MAPEYHKIQTLWTRESEKPCDMIVGLFANSTFTALADLQWVWTEKVDGTNIRVIWDGHRASYGGKTDNAQIPAHLVEKLRALFDGDGLREQFGDTPAVLYGEGFGARIQRGGGNYNPNGADFVLFDVRCGGLWLTRENVEDVAEGAGVDVVPEVGRGTLQSASDFVAKGFDSVWSVQGAGAFKAEGVVLRPWVELQDRRGNRVISKLKHKDFLKLENARVHRENRSPNDS